MAFRRIDVDIMLRGTVLAIVEKLFPEGLPDLREYARENEVAPSSFRRAATWLLGLLPGLLKSRRPGPAAEAALPERTPREEAIQKLEDLRSWLLEQRSRTPKNTCYSPEAKRRIATLSQEIQAAGTLSYGEIARVLRLDDRQLLRIRQEVAAAGGEAPQPKSRAPQKTDELAEEIQRLIVAIESSADTRKPYGPTDIQRILQKNYKEQLRKYHGQETIALSTVRKYMGRALPEEEATGPRRGRFVYPEPFQEVAIDTSYFKVFGVTFYLITVFEIGGRLNLLTRVFRWENTEAVVEVVEEFLLKFPGLNVFVMDRGTPYLNDTVKVLLEGNRRLRVVCPPDTPTAKAGAERHFRTLKDVLRPALEKVFPQNPGWEPGHWVKTLELGIAVFQELYHQISQEGIDGKTPAERAAEFDPVRACARLVDLFQLSLDWQPATEYARELHERFQFPGDPEETVKALKDLPASALRQAAEELARHLEPPRPVWIYDPVGYVAARAREFFRRDLGTGFERKHRQAEAKRARERDTAEREERAAEDRERQEHPERFVDRAFMTLAISLKLGAGEGTSGANLRKLLLALARKLKTAFLHEVERLKGKIPQLAGATPVAMALERFLDDFVGKWQAQTQSTRR